MVREEIADWHARGGPDGASTALEYQARRQHAALHHSFLKDALGENGHTSEVCQTIIELDARRCPHAHIRNNSSR